MEFDHQEGFEKVDTVSKMIGDGYSLQKILDEINKCELVCANCHRMRTLSKNQWCVSSNNGQ